MLTCGSLFSGVGLMDYGLFLAGLRHAWFVESVAYRRRILALRNPGCEVHDDVRTFDALRAAPVDVIAGGFPCRGVSTAGQRTGLAHPETALWSEFARIVGDARPRYVVVENVANILTMHRGAVWGTVLGDLAALGYDAWWDCFPAAAFGAPHLRDRVFLVAVAAHPEPLGHQRWPTTSERAGQPSGEPRRPAARAAADDPPDGLAHRPERGAATRGLLAANGSRPAPDPSRKRGTKPEAIRLPPGERQPGRRTRTSADADGGGLRQQPEPQPERSSTPEPGRTGGFPWGKYEPAIRRWEEIAGPVPEPFIPRVAHGRPRGVDGSRVAALGDGVLVQAARYIGELLMALDRTEAARLAADPVTNQE